MHAATILTLLALASCGTQDADTGPTANEQPPRTSAAAAQEEDDSGRLGALGYVDFAPERSKDRRKGVVKHDAARAARGYNLATVCRRCTVGLFDMQGNVVRAWSGEGDRFWEHAELLPDGDVLVIGADASGRETHDALCEGRFLQRLAFDGTRRWRIELPAHHDIQPRADGNWLVLTAKQRKLPAYDAKNDVVDNSLVVVTPDGKTLEELSLYDVLSKPDSGYEFLRVEQSGNFPVVDLFHSNSIEFVSDAKLHGTQPWFAPQNVLVCMRNQDTIAMFDWDAQRVVWWWGRGELSGPHDARVLANGHILVFDNGLARKWSRVVEVDPATKQIVWQYSTPDRESFYSEARGSSQRLANGNTLVCNSGHGQAFEVTPEGERVWEWLAPLFNSEDQRAAVYRVRRYDAAMVEAILERHGARSPAAK